LSEETIGPADPTIFIECTYTVLNDTNSGIQRVVRNVLRHAPQVASAYGYAVVPVAFDGERLVAIDRDRLLLNKRRAEDILSTAEVGTSDAVKSRPRRSIGRYVREGARRPWRIALRAVIALLPFEPVRHFLYAPPQHVGLARCIRLVSRILGRRPDVPVPGAAGWNLDQRVDCNGDVLLLLDATWEVPPWAAVRRFKRRGGRVAGVIYDLIPITHPETFLPPLPEDFQRWLRMHARLTDAFVAISATVAQQLRGHMRGEERQDGSRSMAPISHFYLGAELDLIDVDDPIRPSIMQIFSRGRLAFLVVGSIEPRKNHGFILDAFDLVWDHCYDATLVILGHSGWKTESFLDRVAKHPELGCRLFMVCDAVDAELDFAYRHASALVVGSSAEGFGLPVVEAFQHGLPVICSDIPVFREIAGGKAAFFDVDNPECLTAVVESFCCNGGPGGKTLRVPQPCLTWGESVLQLFAALVKVLDLPNASIIDPPSTSFP
jgi:alpha-1,2-rhamnosyltransferase